MFYNEPNHRYWENEIVSSEMFRQRNTRKCICAGIQVHESKGEIARAEGALKEVEKFGKDYEFYPMLSFKVAMVEKRLGLTAAEVYSEVQCVCAVSIP